MMASTTGSKWPLSGCGYLEGGLFLRGIKVVRFSSAFRDLPGPAWWQRKIKCRLLRLLIEEVYVATRPGFYTQPPLRQLRLILESRLLCSPLTNRFSDLGFLDGSSGRRRGSCRLCLRFRCGLRARSILCRDVGSRQRAEDEDAILNRHYCVLRQEQNEHSGSVCTLDFEWDVHLKGTSKSHLPSLIPESISDTEAASRAQSTLRRFLLRLLTLLMFLGR
mmetsp:Transcript_37675/g.100243  ORF Transcript_37675/g.100243 Transcript_37675/m.100243 type:complete len:220 (+) Transcript_37675:336-995(+)